MKIIFKYLAVFLFALAFSFCKKNKNKTTPVDEPIKVVTYTNPQGVSKTNSQKIYVHYMPWFSAPAGGNGSWGYHWKMNTKNPNTILANGRRDIASWFYPLIGPYSSFDQDVIDYHFLLMKYAGIDGILADWYGQHNVYDYPGIKTNTDALFSRLPNSNGLEFAICYEDATLNSVLTVKGLDKVTAAQEDLTFLQSAYFKSPNYIKMDNKPLLLCFGPQGLTNAADWTSAFSVLTTKPFFLTLQDHQNLAGSNASGSFAWVQNTNTTNLQNFYTKNPAETSFGGAYPGFRDFYSEGGAGSTLFFIDHPNTLQTTLKLSSDNSAKYVQLITWNDFGEGTMIEPTQDYNFESLEAVQKYTGVTYTVAELQLIYKWYTLRKFYNGNTAIQTQLT